MIEMNIRVEGRRVLKGSTGKASLAKPTRSASTEKADPSSPAKLPADSAIAEKAGVGIPKPRCPKRSHKAAAWIRYYRNTAHWYADIAINLAHDYPNAAAHAQEEAERFAAGARLLLEGQHLNQISGVWR